MMVGGGRVSAISLNISQICEVWHKPNLSRANAMRETVKSLLISLNDSEG